MNKIVSTEEFYSLMCNSGFLRVSKTKGMLRGKAYHCSNPPKPEDFINSIKESLKPISKHKPTLIALIAIALMYDLHLYW